MKSGIVTGVLAFLMGAVLFVGVSGCGNEGETSKGGGEKATSSPAESPVVAAESITAVELAKDFKKDKAGAAAKYKGKVLQISGEVLDPAGGNVQARRVSLSPLAKTDAPDDMVEYRAVNCYLEGPQMGAGSNLTKGQEVTMQGTFSEQDFMGGLTVTNCTIVKAGADPAIVIGATELAKAFSQDKEEAAKKYEGKQVKVEGVVKSLNEKDYELVLEGSGEGEEAVTFVLRLGYEGWNKAKNLKAGEKTKAKGTVAYYSTTKSVHLQNTTRIVD